MFNQKLDALVRACIVYAGNNGPVFLLIFQCFPRVRYLYPWRDLVTWYIVLVKCAVSSLIEKTWIKTWLKKCPDF